MEYLNYWLRKTANETPGDRIKQEQKPPMLENECGTICWLNSVVQLLLIAISDEDINSPLKHIFENLKKSSNLQSTQMIHNYVSEYMLELETGQQDSFDFFVALNRASEMDRESILNPVSIFTKNVMTCLIDPMHTSSSYQPDPEFYISINIPNDNEPIQDIIEREFHEGTLIGDWRCHQCQSQGGMKKKIVQEGLMPRFILVKLRRTERDRNGRTQKVNKDVIPPLGFTIQTEQDNVYAYSLCGVLTHIGRNMHSGHYISEVRQDQQWWKCNDSVITKTSFQNLSRGAYGLLFEQM